MCQPNSFHLQGMVSAKIYYKTGQAFSAPAEPTTKTPHRAEILRYIITHYYYCIVMIVLLAGKRTNMTRKEGKGCSALLCLHDVAITIAYIQFFGANCSEMKYEINAHPLSS